MIGVHVGKQPVNVCQRQGFTAAHATLLFYELFAYRPDLTQRPIQFPLTAYLHLPSDRPVSKHMHTKKPHSPWSRGLGDCIPCLCSSVAPQKCLRTKQRTSLRHCSQERVTREQKGQFYRVLPAMH